MKKLLALLAKKWLIRRYQFYMFEALSIEAELEYSSYLPEEKIEELNQYLLEINTKLDSVASIIYQEFEMLQEDIPTRIIEL